MSHPRVEEVEDSDLEGHSDPSEGDIDDFDDIEIIRAVRPKAAAPPSAPTPDPKSHLLKPSQVPNRGAGSGGGGGSEFQTTNDPKQYADYHCLYPVYFDASRSRAEGRRVPKSMAVKDPLAREMVNACAALRLPTLFEPGKFHPKDWANPGRVKVKLRFPAGKKPYGMAEVNNKHHLYILIAEHLKRNPTTENSAALRARVQGAPAADPNKPYPRPAVPRGWKMNELLPYISPAMTGGGVSENLFKDMMKEMQGGGDPMAALMGQASGSSNPPEPEKTKKAKKGKGK